MNTPTVRTNFLTFLTVMSGIAIIMVLLLHIRTFSYARDYYNNSIQFIQFQDLTLVDKVIEILTRYAVPIFVLIAGFKFAYNLANRPPSYQFQFKRYAISRIKQLVIPYLFWSLLFLLLGIGQKSLEVQFHIGTATQIPTKENLLGLLIGYGNYAFQLWYIPMFMFVSFSIIFVKYVWKKPQVLYGIYVLYLAVLVINPKILDYTYPVGAWIPYFINFELGLYLGKKYHEGKMPRGYYPIVFAWIIGVVLRIINQDRAIDFWFDYYLLWTTPILVYFLVGATVKQDDTGLLYTLGELSWPIYILHAPILIDLMNSFTEKVGITAAWTDVPKIIILLLICIIIYRLASRYIPRVTNFVFQFNQA